MKVLVTGANGQLGRELGRMAAGSPHRFIFTDIRTDGCPSGTLSEDARGLCGGTLPLDITDPCAVERLVKEHGVEVIVNCAAYTDVDRAEDEPEAAMAVNCTAAGNLARAALSAGATLIHISTDYVFDGRASVPYTEDSPTAPLSVYGRTKLAGELAIMESGCRWMIFRTSGLFSPYGRNFVGTIRRLLHQRDSVRVVCDQICTPTYARDLAALILRIIDGNLLERTGIYHFSGEGRCSWYEFALAVAELSAEHYASDIEGKTDGRRTAAKEGVVTPRLSCRISPCTSAEYGARAERPAFSVLDKAKVKRTFGTEIPHWRDSLAACFSEM